MAWTKEIDASGLPVWRGNDSIINVLHPEYNDYAARALFCGLAMLVAAFLIQASLSLSRNGEQPLKIALFLAFIAMACAATIKVKNKMWLGARWALQASSDSLFFHQGSSRGSPAISVEWAAKFSEVARVEAAKTAEYEASRDYAPFRGFPHVAGVSEHEWHVFLFMTDGTRRPIYHANADRDGCAELAASIRAYLETAKSAAPAAAAAPNTPPAAPSVGRDL